MSATCIKNIDSYVLETDKYFSVYLSIVCAFWGFENNELKILIGRNHSFKGNNQWTLPDDMVYADESPHQAIHRMIETYIGIKYLYAQQIQTFVSALNHPHEKVMKIAYYCLVDIGKCKLKANENELQWYAVKNIPHLAFDQKHIFDICLRQLQKDTVSHHVVFNLLPQRFSLRQLQAVYESILDKEVDRRNFRRWIKSMNLLEGLDEKETNVSHRPGRLYRCKSQTTSKVPDEYNFD